MAKICRKADENLVKAIEIQIFNKIHLTVSEQKKIRKKPPKVKTAKKWEFPVEFMRPNTKLANLRAPNLMKIRRSSSHFTETRVPQLGVTDSQPHLIYKIGPKMSDSLFFSFQTFIAQTKSRTVC